MSLKNKLQNQGSNMVIQQAVSTLGQ